MKYKEFIQTDLETSEQLLFNLIQGVSNNSISRSQLMDLLNRLQTFVIDAKEKVELES